MPPGPPRVMTTLSTRETPPNGPLTGRGDRASVASQPIEGEEMKRALALEAVARLRVVRLLGALPLIVQGGSQRLLAGMAKECCFRSGGLTAVAPQG